MNFMIFHMLGIIIPTDFHIFQRGSNHQPVILLCEIVVSPTYLYTVGYCWILLDIVGLFHMDMNIATSEQNPTHLI